MSNLFSRSSSSFVRHSLLAVGCLGLVSFGSLTANPAQAAVINGSFETNDFTGWQTTGDVSTVGTFNGFAPTDGVSQARLTTASTEFPDDNLSNGAYNFSGNPATGARLNTPNLQTFLGLPATALNTPSSLPIPNNPYEGSAIKQSISSTSDFQVSFDWSFLTNDGEAQPFGERDAAFVILYNMNTPQASRTINLLAQSSGNFPAPGSLTSPTFSQTSGAFTFNSGTLAAGDYVLGVGVFDVAGSDKTSALLVDNFQKQAVEVPEPTDPETISTILLLGIGSFGVILKRKNQAQKAIANS